MIGKAAPRSKYGAQPETVDGVRFASRGEARRWCELQLLERANVIDGLRRQVSYALSVLSDHYNDGAINQVTIGAYVADFVYTRHSDQQLIVEDWKGFRTPLYRWKRKHLEAQYGIRIFETGDRRAARSVRTRRAARSRVSRHTRR